MKVVLHVGAHRTGSTTFQHYLAQNEASFAKRGVKIWAPKDTRGGLLSGVIPVEGLKSAEEQLDRARARIAINIAKARARGFETLVISDENMIGAPRRNLRVGKLYPDIGERIARFASAFDGQITHAVLSIRNQDQYWASCLAFAVERGHQPPDERTLSQLASARRAWRDVVVDLACALPDVALTVMPYEIFGGLPERVLAHMTGLADVPRKGARVHLNMCPRLPELRKAVAERGGRLQRLPEAGTGKWQPFASNDVATLRETYADDLFWLRAGAEGLATLTEETGPAKTGKTPRPGQNARGQDDGIEDRRMA